MKLTKDIMMMSHEKRGRELQKLRNVLRRQKLRRKSQGLRMNLQFKILLRKCRRLIS